MKGVVFVPSLHHLALSSSLLHPFKSLQAVTRSLLILLFPRPQKPRSLNPASVGYVLGLDHLGHQDQDHWTSFSLSFCNRGAPTVTVICQVPPTSVKESRTVTSLNLLAIFLPIMEPSTWLARENTLWAPVGHGICCIAQCFPGGQAQASCSRTSGAVEQHHLGCRPWSFPKRSPRRFLSALPLLRAFWPVT